MRPTMRPTMICFCFLLSTLVLALGCGEERDVDEPPGLGPEADAAPPGSPASDAGHSGREGVDAGEGASDAGSRAPLDAGFDAGFDAGLDAGRLDAGARDAGREDPPLADAGTDASPPDPCETSPETCEALAGDYPVAYEMYTAEKVGSIVVNEMRCVGEGTALVASDGALRLAGDLTCDQEGRLGGFGATQDAQIEGTVGLDGAVEAEVTHQFDPFASGSRRTFDVAGTLAAGALALEGTGSWLPNPRSAVPWEVELSVRSTE